MNNGKGTHSDEDLRIIRQANLLFGQLNSGSTIGCVEDINAAAFVTLFEGLCGEQLAGIIRSPVTKEDEIQNLQIVIDTLASEVLHTSLAHISGRDVIESDREAVLNLLEIFSGLMEYILNKIESDASTDGEKDDLEDDPDAVQPDVIDRILERELQRDMTEEFTPENLTPKANRTKTSVYWEDEDASPKKRLSGADHLTPFGNESSTGIRETTASTDRGDSTNELIQEGEQLQKKLESVDRTPVKSSQQIREEIARHRKDLGLDKDPFADLVPVTTSEKLDAYKSAYRHKGTDRPSSQMSDLPRSESYNSLKNMVEETAAMAKAAVDCSPNRANTILQSLENEYNRGRHTRASKSPKKTPTRKAGSPVRKPYDEQFSDSELSPSRAKRKVSFLVDRSTTDSSPSYLKPSPRAKPRVKSAWEESPKKSAYTRPVQDNTKCTSGRGRKVYNSYLDSGSDIENLSYDDYLKKQFHEIIDDVLSDDEVLPPRYKSRSDQRRVRTEKLEKKSKGTYNVVDTQKLLNHEKKSNKEKVDFLEKIYQEDLDELVNEAEYDLKRERKAAKELESQYKKKILTGPKKSSTVKDPSSAKKKAPAQKPVISTKAKKKTPEGLIPSGKPKLTIKDDEDILPTLLKEFPHLHLSLHTWHELWRKGIHQIEQVSRANQEVRRKKSKAKAELEEAEKRHEIMVNIMKKELEHGQRMKEIKERQKQTVVAKNLMREKRSQSARSRKYYDDYQVRLRSKMLKRRTREEMIFRKLFKDGLDIQKDRVRELRKYAKEQRDNQAKSQRTEIESMENYYRDQFEMLAESITKERQEIMTREKAQQKVLGQMKKDIRKKMESEIKNLQDHLVRDDDDAYFRQLDADRVIHDLQLAKYHVNV